MINGETRKTILYWRYFYVLVDLKMYILIGLQIYDKYKINRLV